MQSHEYADKESTLGSFNHHRVRVKVYTVVQESLCSQQCSEHVEWVLDFLS